MRTESGYPCLRQDFDPRRMELLATCVPGLEKLLSARLRQLFPEAGEMQEERGRLHFALTGDIPSLYALDLADNLYLRLWEGPIGPHKADLDAFRISLRRLPLSRFGAALEIRPASRWRIAVSAARSGKHSYSRFDVANAALEALCERPCFLPGDGEEHDLSLRVDVKDEKALLSLKLTGAAFRFRGEERAFSAGAIRPTVAAALVWLTHPAAGDVFLDPFCGSGTIAAERARFPVRRILASDISPQAVAAARRNLPPGAVLLTADARSLPHRDHSVDALATNLPWDVQIQVDDLLALYTDFLREAARVLKCGGALTLLTDKHEALLSACRLTGWTPRAQAQLSLHGLHPAIYTLTR